MCMNARETGDKEINTQAFSYCSSYRVRVVISGRGTNIMHILVLDYYLEACF